MCLILKEIYQTKYGLIDHLKMANLRELVNIFNDIAKPEKPWTDRFLFSLIKGYEGFTFTDQLKRACEIYASELDGQSYWQARIQTQTVITINGLTENIWVVGKELICAYPPCDIIFLRTHSTMKYCPMHRDRKSRKVIK
jgi:hypothetical protein